MNKSLKHYYFIFVGLAFFLLALYGTWVFYVRNFQERYGIAFNETREKLGIDVIPKGWVVKKDDIETTWWVNPKVEDVHVWKMITYKGREIEGELDEYALGFINGKKASLEIETKYKNNFQKVSRTYTLQLGDKAFLVEKQKADNLISLVKR